MRVWCGIDWAERHHDICLVDENGTQPARRRVTDDVAGFTELAALLAGHGATSSEPVPVAIETAKGLVCAALRAAGYQLYPINPLAVSRYRDRYAVSRAKSDPGDAYALANILRTDPGAHRPLPEDSELAQEIRVLARAHQDAIWDRQQTCNKLRSLLRGYYPSFLATFPDLASREARATLALAPAPAAAAGLRKTTLRAALARAGRRRSLHTETSRILSGLRSEQLRQLPRVEAAMSRQALATSGPSTPPLPASPTSSRHSPSLLTSTRTPRPSPASQGSAPSSAPGYSPRSETTGPASTMPKASRPTPTPRRSPAPPANAATSPAASSATNVSARPDTCGLLPAHRIPRRTCPLRQAPRAR